MIAAPSSHPVRRLMLLVSGLALVVGLAGACGGDGTGATSPASASAPASTALVLSAAEFRNKVNAICETGDASIETQAKQALEAGPTPEAAKTVLLETVIPGVEDEIAHAEALIGPADLEDGVRKVTAAVRAQLDHLRDVANGPDPFAAFAGDPFPEAHALAAQYGFTGCRYVEE